MGVTHDVVPYRQRDNARVIIRGRKRTAMFEYHLTMAYTTLQWTYIETQVTSYYSNKIYVPFLQAFAINYYFCVLC